MLHDTTDFVYKHDEVGLLGKALFDKSEKGNWRQEYTVCGLRMHSSLAVTTEGLPLGLAAIKFWSRKEFKGTKARRNKINATRVDIEKKESFRWIQNLQQSTTLLNEPQRCVHIADREGDIYEIWNAAQQAGTHFLVRTHTNRIAKDGASTVEREMDEVAVRGLHRIEVRDKKSAIRDAVLELKYRRLHVSPPRQATAIPLTYAHGYLRTRTQCAQRM